MRKILMLTALALLGTSCLNLDEANPYSADLQELSISLLMPEGYAGTDLSGVAVTLGDVNSGAGYEALCDASGTARFSIPSGLYRASAGSLINEERFNASKGGIILGGSPLSVELQLKKIRTGDILIKEIYCGGCVKLPEEGTYQSDSYIILHNNTDHTVWLDSLCFGTLDPYNSNAAAVWDEDIEFSPVIQAVWQFPGEGRTYPLAPGEDAVVAVYGAIDHTAHYPLSVNLNREDVFTCYSPTYFPNTTYHPAPGDKVSRDRFLNVVIKTGQSNAYTFSISSPAVVIFRTQGQTIQEFVAGSDNVINKPGSSKDRVVCVPNDWVVDGVEVFNGQSSSNRKRMNAAIDASYVTLSNVHEGRTLMRRVNESRSQQLGYEVLVDTNNSGYDFYERETQSIKD